MGDDNQQELFSSRMEVVQLVATIVSGHGVWGILDWSEIHAKIVLLVSDHGRSGTGHTNVIEC